MNRTLNTCRRPFRKMHGLGNDFIIFDGRTDQLDLTEAQVRQLASRNRGIGCDQLITLWPSETADVFMRIQNADGSEVAACGNATRCVGDILLQELGRDRVTIETGAGLLTACRDGDLIRVDMGTPLLDWRDIPLAQDMDTADLDLSVGPLSHGVAVNMGNPHVVFFVPDVAAIVLETLGPEIENHPLFPERVNVSIVEDRGDGHLRHRVWERGAGITEACGSAACATVVAASLRGLVDRKAIIDLDGGTLHMAWDADNHVQMTGAVSYVYEGQIDLGSLA
ncbi:diaminopimelate epimerase [Paremcibacter congregatus]|uniref:Diaminopimelate epimerase n=2 Tax=Paremcibacter congregatus TaxID=2043170 RepID=A0A2G4YQN6_9PROT|nr:diaminopimelate epimerase [Paremcibacter congregatus]QDE29324.1 diaminopimelate epimerase [Paremcibacter congregatus]